MPYSPFADSAHDRRHRRPMQTIAGHPDIPVFGRHADIMHAAGHGSANGSMGRVLRMDSVGLWVIRLDGRMAEIGGRCYWDTLDELQAAAKGAGIALSDLTIHTGRAA